VEAWRQFVSDMKKIRKQAEKEGGLK